MQMAGVPGAAQRPSGISFVSAGLNDPARLVPRR